MFRAELSHLEGIERTRIASPAGVTMRLHRLERPEPWPRALEEEIRRRFPFKRVQRYPSYVPFYDRLSQFTGVPADQIVVGAGIEEFIRTLMAANWGQSVAVLWPTCAMHGLYARAFNVRLTKVQTSPRSLLWMGDLIADLPPDVRLVLLANPGQPVETYFELDELRMLAEICKRRGALLAVDEAYYGFGADTALPLIDEFENVVVLRTFSKAFGAAGIRLGFAMGCPRVIRYLNAVRQSGEVSSLSMHVATVLMDTFDQFVGPGGKEVGRARDWLREKVRAGMGLPTWGRHANHVLIDFGSSAAVEAKAERLKARGIYVRTGFEDELSGCMLVTCGDRDLMAKFYAGLEERA